MKRLLIALPLSALALCVFVYKSSADSGAWTEHFGIDKSDLASTGRNSVFGPADDHADRDLASTGRNPYFILQPDCRLTFEGDDSQRVITVLGETKIIDRVETRVVEERETEGGKLTKVSRKYFAISERTNSVFYFGEDIDTYDDKGVVVNRERIWLAGTGGAKAGLMMPGLPLLGARYYEEMAPRLVMDRAEIVSMDESVHVAAGKFENVLKVEETSPLRPLSREHKLYAPGVGLLKDGNFELVRYEVPEQESQAVKPTGGARGARGLQRQYGQK